jgi:2-phosphoglycerate kinase
MEYSNIERYNYLWSVGKITKPVVITIGGYAGTGKSTIANIITQKLNFANILPTGIVRSFEKKFTSAQQNPSLFMHTFDLHLISKDESDDSIINLFLDQAKPICETINHSIQFISSEKQHYIIDGNHILPKYIHQNEDVILIEFYMKVSNPKVHKSMLEGPTHNRNIGEKQFRTSRIIHDYIVKEATQYKKPIFEFSDGPIKALELIDNFLANTLDNI